MNAPSSLPRWAINPVDCETAVEITLLVSPLIDLDFVEDSREIPAYIGRIVSAFQSAHRDADWDRDDYITAIEGFVAAYILANPVSFIRA